MTKFDKPIKIYLFKDKALISISFLITPNVTNQYYLNVSEMDDILKNYKNGIEFESHCGQYWYIEEKKYGPRPEKIYGPYIRVSVTSYGITTHYRFSTEEFEIMTTEYLHQKANQMYWD